MSTTPPGWYDDGRGALRWWDGSQWTEHVQIPDDEVAASAPQEFPAVANAPTIDQAAYGAPTAGQPTADDAAPDYSAYSGYAGDPAASSPPGYPGGFPGGAAPSGAFISATEPKKSKLWILWVVLGVVLLGIVILITVLIPVIIGLFNTVGGSASPADADQTAAVASVELYDEAWGTADCDKFVASTTVEFRTDQQLAECADFVSASEGFSTSFENYEVTVTSIERDDDDEITVVTTETYDSLYDENGELMDAPVAYADRYTYTIVPSDGGWAIDDLESETE